MSTPKSVVKINKNGVTYTSSVDKANYYLFELSRAALRDVGKFLRKEFMNKYYSRYKKHTGEGPKAFSYKVLSSKNTKYPRVEIGIQHSTPSKTVRGFYTFFLEYRDSLMASIAQSNVPQIVEIESQYLSALEDEAAALRLIDEDEMGEDDGDE